MTKMPVRAVCALLVLCWAGPVLAHPGHPGAAGFAQGFFHPLSGLDHLIAMLAVGFYAGQRGGRAIWILPLAFVAVMAVGGALGAVGVALPMLEQIIGLSVIVMSAAVGLGLRTPIWFAAALIAAFALFHGDAHGLEGGASVSFLRYGAGFIASTALLHIAGIGLALGLERVERGWALTATRISAGAGALAGAALLAGSF